MITALSVLERRFNDNGNPKLVWHIKDCRLNFMSKAKLERYADATETMDVESDNDMLDNSASNSNIYLRSQAVTYLKDSNCTVYCHREEMGKLRKVETFAIHDKLYKKIKKNKFLSTNNKTGIYPRCNSRGCIIPYPLLIKGNVNIDFHQIFDF